MVQVLLILVASLYYVWVNCSSASVKLPLVLKVNNRLHLQEHAAVWSTGSNDILLNLYSKETLLPHNHKKLNLLELFEWGLNNSYCNKKATSTNPIENALMELLLISFKF